MTMNDGDMKAVLEWLKDTDLAEVSFKEGREGFSLSLPTTAPVPAFPPSRYVPVLSPAVGVYRKGSAGKAGAADGSAVARNAVLGMVEQARGKSVPVTAPKAGKIARSFASDGEAVEYGSLLYFIEP